MSNLSNMSGSPIIKGGGYSKSAKVFSGYYRNASYVEFYLRMFQNIRKRGLSTNRIKYLIDQRASTTGSMEQYNLVLKLLGIYNSDIYKASIEDRKITELIDGLELTNEAFEILFRTYDNATDIKSGAWKILQDLESAGRIKNSTKRYLQTIHRLGFIGAIGQNKKQRGRAISTRITEKSDVRKILDFLYNTLQTMVNSGIWNMLDVIDSTEFLMDNGEKANIELGWLGRLPTNEECKALDFAGMDEFCKCYNVLAQEIADNNITKAYRYRLQGNGYTLRSKELTLDMAFYSIAYLEVRDKDSGALLKRCRLIDKNIDIAQSSADRQYRTVYEVSPAFSCDKTQYLDLYSLYKYCARDIIKIKLV